MRQEIKSMIYNYKRLRGRTYHTVWFDRIFPSDIINGMNFEEVRYFLESITYVDLVCITPNDKSYGDDEYYDLVCTVPYNGGYDEDYNDEDEDCTDVDCPVDVEQSEERSVFDRFIFINTSEFYNTHLERVDNYIRKNIKFEIKKALIEQNCRCLIYFYRDVDINVRLLFAKNEELAFHMLRTNKCTIPLCLEFAKRGYCLKDLSYHKSADVRVAVVMAGYCSENLVKDADWRVREGLAMKGKYLDILVSDPDYRVRVRVAMLCYGLKILKDDPHPGVREVVNSLLNPPM